MRPQLDKFSETIGTLAVEMQDLAESLTERPAAALLRAAGMLEQAGDVVDELYRSVGPETTAGVARRWCRRPAAVTVNPVKPTNLQDAGGYIPVSPEEAFLRAVVAGNGVMVACVAAGFSNATLYNRLKRFPEFAAAYAAARTKAAERREVRKRAAAAEDHARLAAVVEAAAGRSALVVDRGAALVTGAVAGSVRPSKSTARAERLARFLEAFARLGSVKRAAEASGCSVAEHYRAVYRDSVYADAVRRIGAEFAARARASAEAKKASKASKAASAAKRQAALAGAAETRRRLLEAFATCGSIYRAAAMADTLHQRHRKWLRAFPDYRREFERLRLLHAQRGTLCRRGRPIENSESKNAA